MVSKTGSGRRGAVVAGSSTSWDRKQRAKAVLAATVPGVPPQPIGLDAVAAAMWPLLTAQLSASGVLSELDGPARAFLLRIAGPPVHRCGGWPSYWTYVVKNAPADYRIFRTVPRRFFEKHRPNARR